MADIQTRLIGLGEMGYEAVQVSAASLRRDVRQPRSGWRHAHRKHIVPRSERRCALVGRPYENEDRQDAGDHKRVEHQHERFHLVAMRTCSYAAGAATLIGGNYNWSWTRR
jgi:hypothetical protein